MKIGDVIIWRMGDEFSCEMVCEHCGGMQVLKRGYNDNHFHLVVIPAMPCKKCGKVRDGTVPEVTNDSQKTGEPGK